MIDKILDHVFLSGASAVISVSGRESLAKLSITRVLTISAMAVPGDKRLPNVEYKFLFAMDLPGQDLIGSGILQEGADYIAKAVEDGVNILIHCEAGISRSATIVAAYLMRRFSWKADKAIMFIRNTRPIIQPNDGFIQQLGVFENLQFGAASTSLPTSSGYKQWCLDTGNVPQNGGSATAGVFVKDLEGSDGEKPKGNKFRCRKCRQALFFGEHLMSHNRCSGEKCTFGFLIEPMKWMQLDEFQGKVNCPSCGEKLGNYSWGGRQCQGESGLKCTEQIVPWVHLHKLKVDEVTPRVPIEQIQRIPVDIPAVIIS